MPLVLGVSTILGLTGVVASFGLFYLGERIFQLDRAHIQTLMYLKLSVAGHLTIFLLNLGDLAERQADIFVQGLVGEDRQDDETDHQQLQGGAPGRTS